MRHEPLPPHFPTSQPPSDFLTDAQAAALVKNWPDPVTALAVMLAEGGIKNPANGQIMVNRKATNIVVKKPDEDQRANGSRDRGVFQINSFWHPSLSDADAYDEFKNTAYAFKISGGGKTFELWNAFKNGRYLQFVARARAALNT